MKIVISLIIVFFSLSSKGQNNQLEDIIKKSLNLYVEKEKESIRNAIEKNKLFFSIDNYPPNFTFEDTIQGIPIKYINLQNASALKKILRKEVGIISLSTIELKKNELIIGFSSYGAKLKKKVLYMYLSEGISFVYEYSCEKQKWILVETKYKWI